MANEIKKYLDKEGLKVLWDQAKAKFIDNTELTSALANYEKIEDLERDYFNKTQVQEKIDALASIYATKTELTEEVTRAQTEEAKKPDKEITSANGKAMLWNEESGGGAKFEHIDGTWSFAGVNDGGADGLAAQVYAVDSNDGYKGVKLDVTKGGIYYTKGDTSGLPVIQRDVEANELITRKDIAGGTHFIGVTELGAGETYEQAITRLLEEKGHTAVSGDIVIIKSTDTDKEFIYDGTRWIELGDQGIYATKTELQDEAATRAQADTTLQTNIEVEKTAREESDEALDERIQYFELSQEPELVEVSGQNYVYANGIALRIEDNTTANIAYYCDSDGVYKTFDIPYGAVVHGGGLGTATRRADFTNSCIIMNGGKLKGIYGGSRAYGSVGTATIIVNGGTLSEGPTGGGAAPNAGEKAFVGKANIIMNGGTSLTVYGGGMGRAVVGEAYIEINAGTHKWITAGGANGTTGKADVVINGGTIICLQTVNRGFMEEAKVRINGGTITNVYAGGETGDAQVTGKCEKAILELEGGTFTLNKGTYGGAEDATRCSGYYFTEVITTAAQRTVAAACNLTADPFSLTSAEIEAICQ